MTNETTANQPTPHQNTLDAITGAIAYGRQGTNPPPSPDHWLAEYWAIGQQLAELGKTSAWDNVTPTASQPKSIGDDAQFQAMTVFMLRSEYDVLVKLIDSFFRAPTAQASATIQAAPEVRLDVDAILAIAAELDQEANNYEGGFADTVSGCAEELERLCATTIQEPVMVAEPVELVGIEQQLKEGAGFWHSCSGCHDTEDGHPTGPYAYSHAMRCALGSGCAKCGGLGACWDNNDYRAEDAAPMVADPAGVALPPLPELESLADLAYAQSTPAEWDADYRNTWQKLQVESRNSMQWRVYALKLRDILAVATVKAVPSEALDAKRDKYGTCLTCYDFGEVHGGACPDCEDDHRAAPLADKTGGGE